MKAAAVVRTGMGRGEKRDEWTSRGRVQGWRREQNYVGDRSDRLAWIWKGWIVRWTDRFLSSIKS